VDTCCNLYVWCDGMYIHHLQPLALEIGFAKITWVLNAPETDYFLQSTELTN